MSVTLSDEQFAKLLSSATGGRTSTPRKIAAVKSPVIAAAEAAKGAPLTLAEIRATGDIAAPCGKTFASAKGLAAHLGWHDKA